jgi:hypothetical protein
VHPRPIDAGERSNESKQPKEPKRIDQDYFEVE